jgi:hypothetical protein
VVYAGGRRRAGEPGRVAARRVHGIGDHDHPVPGVGQADRLVRHAHIGLETGQDRRPAPRTHDVLAVGQPEHGLGEDRRRRRQRCEGGCVGGPSGRLLASGPLCCRSSSVTIAGMPSAVAAAASHVARLAAVTALAASLASRRSPQNAGCRSTTMSMLSSRAISGIAVSPGPRPCARRACAACPRASPAPARSGCRGPRRSARQTASGAPATGQPRDPCRRPAPPRCAR